MPVGKEFNWMRLSLVAREWCSDTPFSGADDKISNLFITIYSNIKSNVDAGRMFIL